MEKHIFVVVSFVDLFIFFFFRFTLGRSSERQQIVNSLKTFDKKKPEKEKKTTPANKIKNRVEEYDCLLAIAKTNIMDNKWILSIYCTPSIDEPSHIRLSIMVIVAVSTAIIVYFRKVSTLVTVNHLKRYSVYGVQCN